MTTLKQALFTGIFAGGMALLVGIDSAFQAIILGASYPIFYEIRKSI